MYGEPLIHVAKEVIEWLRNPAKQVRAFPKSSKAGQRNSTEPTYHQSNPFESKREKLFDAAVHALDPEFPSTGNPLERLPVREPELIMGAREWLNKYKPVAKLIVSSSS